MYGFGQRFDSFIKNKNHINPNKIDGPGPGSYKVPSALQSPRNDPYATSRRTTFGTSARAKAEPKSQTPAPNRYRAS